LLDELNPIGITIEIVGFILILVAAKQMPIKALHRV
jgi:hypothetical protein